ncbi:uncharacterized protein yc1106_08786 [Curvularia clavata]|uniref:Uncharacterized protein n=1 Tax=Curvularia clavata TaxID=95742 RepID=A0A9Q8ZGF2_CURCL|nr:uncharacterized protein yc1106_08786 [Curvularia clavata]
MADNGPAISLYLNGSLSLQLRNKGFSGTTPTLQIQMHDVSHAATLVIPGYDASTETFSLSLALQGGLVDLLDVDTNENVLVPSVDEKTGKLLVEAGARNRWFDLKIDFHRDFWTQLLTPGHKYHIRWRDDREFPWAFRGKDRQNSPERLPVRLLPRPIKLNVLDSAATPLQLSISLSSTADTCHLSGEPCFGFTLQVVSHDEKVVTVCLHKTPLKELHGLEEIAYIVNEQGEKAEWPYGIGCFEGSESFPSDDMFEELIPNVPFGRRFWLRKLDKKTSSGGELEELESGQSYTARISKKLFEAFSNWRRGTKEELLAGEEKEKEARWRGTSEHMLLDVSDPFKFKVV